MAEADSGLAGSSTPTVTVVVVTFRAAAFIRDTLAGIASQDAPHRLLVVDNASTDGTAAILSAELEPDQVRRLPRNTGFAGGVAEALAHVGTPYVALLNDDAVPEPGWLSALLKAADGDSAAAAWTSLMVLADRPDRVNNRGVALNAAWYGIDVGAAEPVQAMPALTTTVFGFCGGAALLRTAAVRAVGGFPAEFFLYYEDLDTSWRLRRAGWTIRFVPTARVLHRHAATSNRTSHLFHFHNERNRLLMLVRCAPLAVAPLQFVRFLLTTASLAVARTVRSDVPDNANFQVTLRLRVALSALRMAPGQYRRRRPATIRRRKQGHRRPG